MPTRIQGQAPDFKKAARRVLTAREQVARDAAAEIKKRAQELAPVRSGRLRDSITYSRVAQGYEVGPTVFYARMVEFGTASRAPSPYLIPAGEQVEPTFIEAMRSAAEQALEV